MTKESLKCKRLLIWIKKIGCLMLIGSMLCSDPVSIWAASTSKIEKEKKEAEKKLNEAKKQAEEAEEKKKAAQSQVAKMDNELTEILSVIRILETEMASKEVEIKQAKQDYVEAQAQEKKQYEAMKKRIKYMYEKGDTEYLEILLQVKSMSDLLNKAEYVQDLYTYDKKMLTVFQETKKQVQELKNGLEEDKAEMEVMEDEYMGQKAELESMIAKKRKEVSNFDSQLEQAKKDAAIYAKTVEEKTAKIKKQQEEARRKAEEERKKAEAKAKAKSATTPKNSSKTKNKDYVTGPGAVKSSGGTAQGRAIADYGLQFVGNPYVYGGNSLTNGTDCSGFTKGVYSHFGISLPRTSSEQAKVGRAVEYSDLQPGDLVAYAGHVAIYIGNGQIVHASSAKTGIKVSDVDYRTILAMRRVL